jgi:hypothetical protein
MYDSASDTIKHIYKVEELLYRVIGMLQERAYEHDATKLEYPEKDIFDEYIPRLEATEYGSDEYKECLKGMNVALEHHYKENQHHPEHFEMGIEGMNIVDIIEMFCDWKAASMRNNTGDLRKSIEINQKRFLFSDELATIFRNSISLFD